MTPQSRVDTPWMTVAQAVDYTQRGRHTLLAALDDDSLRGYRRTDRGRWRIHVDDLDAWMRGEVAPVRVASRRTA